MGERPSEAVEFLAADKGQWKGTQYVCEEPCGCVWFAFEEPTDWHAFYRYSACEITYIRPASGSAPDLRDELALLRKAWMKDARTGGLASKRYTIDQAIGDVGLLLKKHGERLLVEQERCAECGSGVTHICGGGGPTAYSSRCRLCNPEGPPCPACAPTEARPESRMQSTEGA